MTLEGVAVRLARRGIAVLPLQPRGKIPLCEHGSHDATTDADQVRAWWGETPDANIGIATGRVSGLVVVDIDGDEGEESFLELQREHGTIPDTLWARTGSGGWHLYFQHPGKDVRNSAGRLAPHVDVRGESGYIVAPPSVHPCGEPYRWHTDTKPVDPPAWLVDLLCPPPPPPRKPIRVGTASAYAEAALNAEADAVANAPRGTRNHTLNAAAFSLGQLVAAGQLSSSDAWCALHDAGLACGLPEREVRVTLRSGLAAGQEHPRKVSA